MGSTSLPETCAAMSRCFRLLSFGSIIIDLRLLPSFAALGVCVSNSFKSWRGPTLNLAGSELSLGYARASVIAVHQVLPAVVHSFKHVRNEDDQRPALNLELAEVVPPAAQWIGGGPFLLLALVCLIGADLLAKVRPSQDEAQKYKTWQVQIARRKAGRRRETGRHWSGATCSFSCKMARCEAAGLSFVQAVV